jgi:hypothetical protein
MEVGEQRWTSVLPSHGRGHWFDPSTDHHSKRWRNKPIGSSSVSRCEIALHLFGTVSAATPAAIHLDGGAKCRFADVPVC